MQHSFQHGKSCYGLAWRGDQVMDHFEELLKYMDFSLCISPSTFEMCYLRGPQYFSKWLPNLILFEYEMYTYLKSLGIFLTNDHLVILEK